MQNENNNIAHSAKKYIINEHKRASNFEKQANQLTKNANIFRQKAVKIRKNANEQRNIFGNNPNPNNRIGSYIRKNALKWKGQTKFSKKQTSLNNSTNNRNINAPTTPTKVSNRVKYFENKARNNQSNTNVVAPTTQKQVSNRRQNFANNQQRLRSSRSNLVNGFKKPRNRSKNIDETVNKGQNLINNLQGGSRSFLKRSRRNRTKKASIPSANPKKKRSIQNNLKSLVNILGWRGARNHKNPLIRVGLLTRNNYNKIRSPEGMQNTAVAQKIIKNLKKKHKENLPERGYY